MSNIKEHNYNSIDVTIIADSTNKFGNRITSFVLTFPRIVLAEFNTHRVLSRNSASSRAVPFDKMLESVNNHPFIPIKWLADHKGMQGEELIPEVERAVAESIWLRAKDSAIRWGLELNKDLNVSKQFVNRLLEPFKWHTVIATGTEWENFFALRAHPAAEIHIAQLADKMLSAYNTSTPKELKEGEWHIPFGDKIDYNRVDNDLIIKNGHSPLNTDRIILLQNEYAIKIATARCARVSYENFDGSDDYVKDIALCDRLSSMGHWSPFEHCARAMSDKEYGNNVAGYIEGLFDFNSYDPLIDDTEVEKGYSGNFRGFTQYRKMFDNENKSDERVINK